MNLNNKIYRYESVTSTNDILYSMACGGAENGTVVLANHQSLGKGSNGRKWISDAGVNIYCSILLKNNLTISESTILPIITGLGIARILEKQMQHSVGIKWPNDLIVNYRKICGILAEYYEYNDQKFIIIGFGINVNQKDIAPEIADKASSMYLLEKRLFDLDLLLFKILEELSVIYDTTIENRNATNYMDEINEKFIGRDRKVELRIGENVRSIILKEINANGTLRARFEDGTEHDICAGEVVLQEDGRYVKCL